jgi:uncharacterized tellurite resistance protein B-like protein
MNFLEHFDHPERKQDKEHFTHLLQVALADGKIENSELEMLYRSGRKLGLTKEEIDILLENSKNSAFVPPYELSKRFGQLYDIIKMVYADGQVNNNEMRLATGLAIKLGFAEEEIPFLLTLLINGVKNGEDEEDLLAMYKKKRLVK